MGGSAGSFYALRFLKKVFSFAFVPQGNYYKGYLLSTTTTSLINLLFILLLLVGLSLHLEQTIFFPIDYFLLFCKREHR